MKKQATIPARKHGYRARAQMISRTLCLQYDFTDTRQAAQARQRLKTQVTFQSGTQCYLWTTDRGRSRLIKH